VRFPKCCQREFLAAIAAVFEPLRKSSFALQ
jgi:hypothetical protein